MEITIQQLTDQLEKSGIVGQGQVAAVLERAGALEGGVSAKSLAKLLVKEGHLTRFQAQLAYGGKAKNLVMGSYVILEKLGEGGMGQVYKARHKRMKREVALKVLAPQFVKDSAALQRFHREVEAAARLTHPNIVTAFDADEVRGTHYLVMEYVRGHDLSQIVKASGPLSVSKAVNYVMQAATGLAYAHDQNVVHRDIKPSNLLLDDSGTVKILDMGLARFDEAPTDADQAAALTGTGMLMGTVDYMSPEQAMDSKTADHRSDIYSLGCTLHLLITGQPMYSGDTVMKRVMAHQTAAIPQLPVGDARLQQIFETLVAKKAADRFQSTAEVVAELSAWLHDHRDQVSMQATAEMPLQPQSLSSSLQTGLSADSTGGQKTQTRTTREQSQSQLEPTTDTSPSSSAFAETVLPGNSPGNTPAEPTVVPKTSGDSAAVPPQTLNVAAVAIKTMDEPLLPDKRRASRRQGKSKTKPQTAPSRSVSRGGMFGNRKLLLAGGGALAALILFSVLTFKFRGKDGTVIVQLDSEVDIAAVEVDGTSVSFSPNGTDRQLQFTVDPGSHALTLKTTEGVELTTNLGPKPLEIKAGATTKLRAWVHKMVDKAPNPVTTQDVDYAAERAAVEWWAEKLQAGFIRLQLEGEAAQTYDITPENRSVPPGKFRLIALDEIEGNYVDDSTLQRLASCKLLHYLRLINSQVTGEGLNKLGGCKALRELALLEGKNLSDGFWGCLNSWPELQVLTLHNCPNINDPTELPTLAKLWQFDGFRNLTELGLQRIIAASPNLSDVHLFETAVVNLNSLKQAEKLECLRCGASQLNDYNIEILARMPAMAKLTISSGGDLTDATVESLLPLKEKLRRLDLYFNVLQHQPMTSQGFQLLPQFREVQELFINGNICCPNDNDLLVLASMPKLSYLNLRFAEKSTYPADQQQEFPRLGRRYTPAGIEAFRKARPDVRLEVDGVVSEATTNVAPMILDTPTIPPQSESTSVPSGTDARMVAGTPDPGDKAGTQATLALAPLELRMQPRANDLPKFQNTLRAGQPLGEFAAVSRPGKVKDIISWSVEPVLHRGGFRCIDVRADGTIVTGGFDGALRIWTKDWQLIKVLPGHANSVNAVKFSPDGKMLASVSSAPRDMLAVWDVGSGQLLKFHDVENWQGHLAWKPDGTQILHISKNKPELIEPLTGKRTIADGNGSGFNNGMATAFSPDGERFVVGDEKGSVYIVDAKTLSLVKTLPNSEAGFVDWSADGKWIAIGKTQGVDILDTRSFQIRHSLDFGGAVRFSPDSTAIAVGHHGGVAAYRTSDWEKRFHKEAGVGNYEFAWTPDSRSLLTPVCILDADSGRMTATYNHVALPEVAVAVSDNGELVATATSSRLRIFDGAKGSLLRQFPLAQIRHDQLIWQPGGKLLLRVDRRHAEHPDQISLMDSETGRTAQQLIGHKDLVWWASWSPDGKQIASVGNDGMCRIWDAATGQEVRSLVHDDPQWWVVWDQSGTHIATGSAFSQITVWEAANGKRLKEFKTLSQPLPKPDLHRASDAPFAFLKNPSQIIYMAGWDFEMLDVSTGQISALGKANIPGGDRLSIGWSPDFSVMGLYCGYGEFHLIRQGEDKSFDVRYFTSPHWLADGRRLFGGNNSSCWVAGYDYRRHRRLGVLFPELPEDAWGALGSDGHYVGSESMESNVVVVLLHVDGRLLTLTPAEFRERFGWKNDVNKVRILP